MIYTYEEVVKKIRELDWEIILMPKRFSMNQKITLQNEKGYKFELKPSNIMKHVKGDIPKIVNKTNPYSIDNINTYLLERNSNFTCISKKYIDKKQDLLFQCKQCGEKVTQKWGNVYRNDNNNRHCVLCPNCNGRTESIHALVLKQMFLYYYPDTKVEDPSCINPLTNRIMPTDIVNHRLKIAIEVQSQWHDFEDSKIKGKIKKDFWINNGYKFYDPDIRDYSVLEMCKLFFDIDSIPDFINYEYSNKINIKKLQYDLNQGLTVSEIANKHNINVHRIYDALHYKKLYYPDNYQRTDQSPVIQIDLYGKVIKWYDTIAQAGQENNIPAGNIVSTLVDGRHYSGGYIWFYKKDYYEGCFQEVKSSYIKFNVPVEQYSLDGTYIKTFDTIFEAAKDLGVNNASIYRVASGKRKSIKGFTYKLI